MLQETLIAISIALVRIVAALVLSTGTLYSGMRLLDSLTSGIDEWKEIRRGNIAIGVLFSSVMASLLLLVCPAIDGVVWSIGAGDGPLQMAAMISLSLFNYVLALIAGIIVIFLTLNLIDRITPDVDEFAELKKGNVAVGLVMASALLLVALASRMHFGFFLFLIRNAELALLG